jgi:hypothetical protein
MLIFNISLLAQERDSFIQIDGHPGQKVPKSLLTVVTVNLDDVEFEEALAVISEKGDFKLSFNRSRIPLHKKVTVNMENAYALEALLHILERTGTELLVTKDGQLAIVPSKDRDNRRGTIKGRVLDKETQEPLMYTNISVVGTNMGGITNENGGFILDNIPVGVRTLQFSYIGYETRRVENVSVIGSADVNLVIELIPQAISLADVTVTPSQFSIMGQEPAVKQTLTQRDLQTIPFGEDIYRAITRLPGISASDFSAKFTVRGGENEEILLLMDGMELQEPFHLKDIEGGALSIIDIAAIEGIDLMTGGFSAEYGDRMSGVFKIKTRSAPVGKKQTSLGLSFMNARIMSEGTFSNDKGSWLFSARRGYLDLVLDLMGEQDPPRPVYYDVLGKVSYGIGKKHTLTANVLHAWDRLDFVEDDDDEDKTKYGNSYGWLTLKSMPSSRLFVQSLVSYGKLVNDREGIGYDGDSETVEFTVSDENNVDILGLKQDWNLELSDRWYLKWGFDLKSLSASYDYFSSKRNVIWDTGDNYTIRIDTNQVDLDPSGKKFGVYLSNRFRILSPLVTEIGLRYDSNSYANDELFSPRLNLVYELGKQTFLRAGWGYFYQSQGIHEIKVCEGEDQFYPAELAEHWVVGLEHTFRNGFNLRLEGYYKDLSDLRPYYRKFSNDVEIFPEMQYDRFKLNLSGARSKGIEAYFKYDRGGKFTWWASYALAYAEEKIRSLIFEGIEYPGGDKFYPGKFDQRHTFYLDMNYRPNRKWHFNISWQYHTGWPYTESLIESRQLPDGSTQYNRAYGEFNDANYPSYQRLDLRINRHFYTSTGRISAFMSLINLYDRGNVRNIDYSWQWRNDRPALIGENEYWFKLLPSIGITWHWEQKNGVKNKRG